MPITAADAQNITNDAAWKDLRRVLLIGLLGGASARAGAGIYGNITRNIRAGQVRNDEKGSPPEEITLPVRKAAAETPSAGSPPRPGWFVPSAVLGTAGATYAGWAGVSRLLKAYRKAQTRQELAAAKQEFEDAMSSESQMKFSSDLTKLAEAWVDGSLDKDLEKAAGLLDYAVTTAKAVPPAYYTLAALMTGLGGIGGWKMMGSNPEDEKLRAYREAARRRRIARPVSIVAKPAPPEQPKEDSTNRPEVKEPQEKSSAMYKRAVNWAKTLRGAGKFLGSAAVGGIGSSLLMTKTPFGRKYLGGRAEDLMRDPEFIRHAIGSLSTNPAVMSSLYEQMIPAIKQQMIARNPWMGRLAQHFV